MSATTYTFTPENSYILNRLGANNGIAELDSSGKVPASQLPSYVDDVVEASTYDDFPVTGESGKIYVDLSTNKTYRWGGSSYVEISESLALGETENTAYRGDRGKEAYDHAMAKGRGFSSGFYKVATNTEGHVTNVVPVAKSDIVNLGIPGDDFVGATADATGVHGYVPAPAVEDRNKFLSGNGTWKEAPGAKLIEVILTPVSNESGAYTGTTRDFRITAGMKCIMLELGNPAAFKSNITVTAGAGIVTLTCASVEGESSATASFLKTAEDPTAITTSEFDYLENAKVDKAPTAIEGHFVSFNTVGNLIDSGYSANNVLIVPSGVTEGKVPQTNSNGEIVWTDLESVTVENSLTSTSTTNALSAAQGKALNDTKAPIDSPNFTGSISLGRIADTTVGAGSVAEGASVTASGSNSHAEGIGTTASGQSSHAEGSSTFASGLNSHAEGGGTIASGNSSHSEGVSTTASGSYSHAEGASTTASKNYSHAEGTGTTASGNGSHAEGGGTIAPGNYSHAEGRDTKANGDQSHAEGAGTTASGDHSHAEGDSTTASGQGSHAEGLSTRAYGRGSHAEGNNTIAAGSKSHVSGEYNVEDSYNNWPEWTANTSYEVGDKVKVTTGSGSSQTIEGYICKTANSDSTFTSSKWTDQFGKMNYAEIIGNGLYDSSRSNARALDWDGNEHLAGDLYVHCNADSTGGNKVATTTDLANKLDKPSNIPAGKFLQTDSNGNAVWSDAASPTDVANAVTNWLNDNIPTGQTVAVDQSLTVSGAAADAKKTGDQLSDLKSALSESTRNLFDIFAVPAKSNITNIDGVLRGTAGSFNSGYGSSTVGLTSGTTFEENTQYVLSFDAKCESGGSGNGLSVSFVYSDGTIENLVCNKNESEYTHHYGVSTSDKTISKVCVSYYSGGTDIWNIKNIQIEKGTAQTAYIPHLSATDYLFRESASNEINGIKKQIKIMNSENLFTKVKTQTKTNLTYTSTGNGFIILNGSNASDTYFDISELPDLPVEAGKEYWLNYGSEGSGKSYLAIYFNTGSGLSLAYNNLYGENKIKVPSNVTGMLLRLYAKANVSFSNTVYALTISENKSNHDLETKYANFVFLQAFGTGDCTAIKFNDGTVLVVDFGLAEGQHTLHRSWKRAVMELGITHIDYGIISHYHMDHVGLLIDQDTTDQDYIDISQYINENTTFFLPNEHAYTTEELNTLAWVDEMFTTDHVVQNYQAVMSKLTTLGCKIIYPEENSIYMIGNCPVQFWNADQEWIMDKFADHETYDYNEASMCNYITIGSSRILFSGDIGTLAMNKYKFTVLASQIFKVNHHSIGYDVVPLFLNSLMPKLDISMLGHNLAINRLGSNPNQAWCESNNVPNVVTGINEKNLSLNVSENGWKWNTSCRRLICADEGIPTT